jgi:hypothetical protein
LIPNFEQFFFNDKKSSNDKALLQIIAILEKISLKFIIFDKYKRLIKPFENIPIFDIPVKNFNKFDQFVFL